MNTLLALHQKPVLISNPSSWDQTRSQPQHYYPPASLKTLSWRLHAQGKGFGGKQENENAPKPSSRKQENGDGDDDDQIPQIVFDRMIRRILTSVGVPLVAGIVLLKLLDSLNENHLWEVPLWVPFITTFLTFGSSVLGIAYGSLSTSWDPHKEGSFLGLENANHNWTEMWKEDESNK